MPHRSSLPIVDRLLTWLALGTGLFAALRLSRRAMPWGSAPLAFTPYVAAAGTLLSVVAHRRSRGAAGAISGFAAAGLWAAVLPRLRTGAQPAAPAGGLRVRIMSVNVLKGRADPQALVALIRELQPDVVAIQEQSPRFLRQLAEAGIDDLLPHGIGGDGDRNNDAGLLSRHPLEVGLYRLPPELIGARVTFPTGQQVPVISAHPYPPVGRRAERAWTSSLATAPAPEGDFAGALMAGDLNASFDHPQFRGLLARGWRDAAALAGQGWRFTWVGQHLGLLRLAIDHVLVPPGAVVESVRVDDVPGSDHRAVTATVVLPPPAAN